MACPECGCKVTYSIGNEDTGEDTGLMRCSACRAVIYEEDDEPEDDDYEAHELNGTNPNPPECDPRC